MIQIPGISGLFLPIVCSILLVLPIIYVFYRNKYKVVQAECWFCRGKFQLSSQSLNSFYCPFCEQYNGFAPNGDYDRDIPKQRLPHLNSYLHKDHAKTFQTKSDILCSSCCDKQNKKIDMLAKFEPIDENTWDQEYKVYKSLVDSKFELCPSCRANVASRVHEVDNELLPGFLEWWRRFNMKKSRAIRPSLSQKLSQETISVASTKAAYLLDFFRISIRLVSCICLGALYIGPFIHATYRYACCPNLGAAQEKSPFLFSVATALISSVNRSFFRSKVGCSSLMSLSESLLLNASSQISLLAFSCFTQILCLLLRIYDSLVKKSALIVYDLLIAVLIANLFFHRIQTGYILYSSSFPNIENTTTHRNFHLFLLSILFILCFTIFLLSFIAWIPQCFSNWRLQQNLIAEAWPDLTNISINRGNSQHICRIANHEKSEFNEKQSSYNIANPSRNKISQFPATKKIGYASSRYSEPPKPTFIPKARPAHSATGCSRKFSTSTSPASDNRSVNCYSGLFRPPILVWPPSANNLLYNKSSLVSTHSRLSHGSPSNKEILKEFPYPDDYCSNCDCDKESMFTSVSQRNRSRSHSRSSRSASRSRSRSRTRGIRRRHHKGILRVLLIFLFGRYDTWQDVREELTSLLNSTIVGLTAFGLYCLVYTLLTNLV